MKGKSLARLFSVGAVALTLATNVGAASPAQPTERASSAPQSIAPCSLFSSPTELQSAALINFDDLPNGSTIGTQYHPIFGVSFNDDSMSRAVIDGNEPAKAHSRPNVARNEPSPSNGAPMTITFASPKTHVGFYLGNGRNLSPTATITAYNVDGLPLCSTQSSNVPDAATQFVGITLPNGGIAKVTIDYGDSAQSVMIDDLYFAPNRPAQPKGNIAYVYRGNTLDATTFRFLLTSRGYGVTLVPLGSVLGTNFDNFDLILIADDSGSLDTWGLPGMTAAEVDQITKPNKPIIGLGEGGYAFFGRLPIFIGWGNGWHGPDTDLTMSPTAPPAIFTTPNAVPTTTVVVYTNPVNTVAIYVKNKPSDVLPIGDDTPPTDHSPLIMQGCRFLWGYSGNPTLMTGDGKNLFENLVEYARTFQCGNLPPPPETCVGITKISNPPDGTPVVPGTQIQYTLVYTFNIFSPQCKDLRLPDAGNLVDAVPQNTLFVPSNSATGAPPVMPGPDGTLHWGVTPSVEVRSETFSVQVADSACDGQKTITNRAVLMLPGRPPVVSNVVSHPVVCPPISFPNHEPPYAEDEVQINPYPILAGQPATVSVRLTNNTITPTTVVVSFQTSPDKFGIGLSFGTIASKTITIPAMGHAILQTPITLFESGHYCIQVRVDIPGWGPIFTQRNLDVTEDLKASTPNTLTFKVGNPTAFTGTINLVVINTCPGFSAVVIPSTLLNVGPGQVQTAQLVVTPPNPVVLGSGCHIDVQGWITFQGSTGTLETRFLGGIRKLDVPPVHLPHDVQPPWLEPEISVGHTPIVVGLPNQLCIQLQNPLPFTRTVTVVFAVADFGAGIPFTPVATPTLTLPPMSNNTYCIPWTPAAGGTLHRCVLVTLKQPGYQDESSQHNLDLIRGIPIRPIGGVIHFVVGNPDLVTHTLQLKPIVYGIDPFWQVIIRLHNLPDPPPDVIGPGETLEFDLGLAPMAGLAREPVAAPADFRYGDVSRVDVAVVEDGAQIGGISAEFSTYTVYMPYMAR